MHGSMCTASSPHAFPNLLAMQSAPLCSLYYMSQHRLHSKTTAGRNKLLLHDQLLSTHSAVVLDQAILVKMLLLQSGDSDSMGA